MGGSQRGRPSFPGARARTVLLALSWAMNIAWLARRKALWRNLATLVFAKQMQAIPDSVQAASAPPDELSCRWLQGCRNRWHRHLALAPVYPPRIGLDEFMQFLETVVFRIKAGEFSHADPELLVIPPSGCAISSSAVVDGVSNAGSTSLHITPVPSSGIPFQSAAHPCPMA